MPPIRSSTRNNTNQDALTQRRFLEAASLSQHTESPPKSTQSTPKSMSALLFRLYNFLNNEAAFSYIFSIMLIFDLVFTIVILWKIPYTEIDWIAYMQEVSGFLGGELNYLNLKGDTGPLVYPAGFLYIYSALYYITNNGKSIFIAQCIFAIIYLVSIAIASLILYKSKLVPIIMIPMIYISKRLHSIYMLRCFNDTIAMLCVYIAILLLLKNHYYWCSTFMSLGLSIKMNVLLFFPGLAMIYLMKYSRIFDLLKHALVVIAVQFILGFPFIMTYPREYISKAFEFSRVFTYIWTVNWKCLDEETFLSPFFARVLLILLAVTLLSIFCYLDWAHILHKWIPGHLSLPKHQQKIYTNYSPTPQCIVSHLYLSNFIGILLSRSLHYQFYSWYAPTIPLILSLAFSIYQSPSRLSSSENAFSTFFRITGAYFAFLIIEWTWNVFPSNFKSSLVWQLSHWIIFLLIVANLSNIRKSAVG